MGVSCGRGKEDEDLMFKRIFRGCNLNCVKACS